MALVLTLILSSCLKLTEEPMPIEKNALGDNKILILSHHTLDADYLEYTWQNHKRYAQKNAYDYWFRNGKIDGNKFSDPDGKNDIFKHGLYWQKVAAAEQALAITDENNNPAYRWVMWIDADAFFTDLDKRIETIISSVNDDAFFIISEDYPEATV